MGRRVTIWGLALAGCYGGVDGVEDVVDSSTGAVDDGGSGEPAENEGEADVGLDVDAIALDEVCVAAGDDTVLGVGPEGHLWLGSGPAVRAVDPDGTEDEIELPFAVDVARPWSSTRATVVADGGLWTFADGEVEAIRWLDGTVPAGFCGDPAVDGDGLVLADDVYSRDAGQWWQWGLPLEADAVLADVAGACSGPDATVWLHSGGEVWSLAPDWVGAHPELEPASALAADEAFGVAAVVEGELRIVDAPVRFEAGPVGTIAAAPGVLWVTAGERLYRLHDDRFVEATRGEGEPAIAAEALWADAAGGIWARVGDDLCRYAEGPAVTVEGIRPYERRRDAVVEAAIHVEDGTAAITVDGEPMDTDAESGTFSFITEVHDEGWHDLTVSLGGEVVRTLTFEVDHLSVASWTEDIEPLFADNCAGTACHGPDVDTPERPDLSSRTGWEESQAAIMQRVVLVGDMPPLGDRDETWGIDEVLLVMGWLDDGLPEEEE